MITYTQQRRRAELFPAVEQALRDFLLAANEPYYEDRHKALRAASEKANLLLAQIEEDTDL